MNKCKPGCWIGTVLLLLVMAAPAQALSLQSQPQPPPPPAANDFSEAVATRLLDKLRSGLESGSLEDMLDTFDREKMPNYNAFRDQLRSFLSKYQEVRVRYHITQTWSENGRGIALVDFEMEGVPTSGCIPPLHSQGQIRFEFGRGRTGWKIVDLDPREFFS